MRHTVSFYDYALVVAEVADLVGGALLGDRSSAVIATADHRARVEALLESLPPSSRTWTRSLTDTWRSPRRSCLARARRLAAATEEAWPTQYEKAL